MDDAWRIKCGSAWAPPASPSPAPQLPPPVVAASQVLPPASGYQMDIYSHQKFQPFVSRGAEVEDAAFIQEPMGLGSLNTGSSKASRTEMANSFLALLSGPSHLLTCDFPQLSKSGSSLSTTKLPACDIGNVASSVECSVSVPYMSALSAYHGSNTMANGSEHSSYSVTRLPSVSSCSDPPILCNDLQVFGSQFPSSHAGKLVTSLAHQGNERGLAVSSSNNTYANQQQRLNIRAHPIRQADTCTNASSHVSSFIRGCPRVFCVDKVGELFVSDNGLLGVFCLCHNLRMSVAKFCEHSGSHAVNPGDAVHLENGETVAQWRKLFFLNIGVRVPDDGSGWDWPDGTFMPGSLGRSKANSLLQSNNRETVQLQEPLSEIGRSEGLANGPASHFPHMGVTALEKLLNRFQQNTGNRNSYEGIHIASTCSTSSVPINEHMLKAVKENHPFVNPSMLKPTFTIRQQGSGNKLIANNVSAIGKPGDFSTSYSSSGSVKSFGGDFSANRTNISSNAHLTNMDSTPSNIELRLGQPYEQSHDFVMSNTAAMRQQFLGHGPQKQPVHHPISKASVMSRTPENFTRNVYHTPSQVSTSNGTLLRQACGNMDATHIPEQEMVNAHEDKNSLISLFLSHFSTSERKIKSQVAENITGISENLVPSLVDCNSLSAKCGIIDFSRNVNKGIETKSNMNIPKFSNQIEKKKGVKVAVEDELYMTKPSLQNKQIGDLRVLVDSNNGHSCHDTSLCDRQNSACFHQSFSRRLQEPDARHSNEFGETSFLANTDMHDKVFLRCRNAGAASLSGSPASNFFSSNPLYFSGQASSLPKKMNVNITQHLVDENVRFPALKHAMQLSKQVHLHASLGMSDQQRQLYRPSSMGILRKGSREDLTACEDIRHEQHCTTLQEASSIAFRPPHSCSNCCSYGVAESLSGKTCTAGTNRICNQTGCMQDTSLYSKEKHVKSPSCHVCNDDEQSFLRLFRTDSKTTELADYEMFIQKEGNSFIPGKCSCCIHLKCLKGCHLCRGEGSSDSFKEHSVCGKSHTLIPAYDIDHLSQDRGRIALSKFDASRHVMVNDDCQSAFVRDIPSKAFRNSDATTVQNAEEMLPAVVSIDHQLTENAAKDFDRTREQTDSVKKQRMSSILSACSAPVVTEISVEENNVDSCTGGIGDARSPFNAVVDEGSVIENNEKCGSSDDIYDNTQWDEAVTLDDKVDYQKVSNYASCHTSRNQNDETSHQSGKFMNEANLGKSFISRKKRNQFPAECTVKESNMNREPTTKGWRAERNKKATKWRRLDGSSTASGLSLINQGSSHDGHLELQCSSEGLKSPDLPQNTTQRICINTKESSGGKRKHYALSSAESLPWGTSDRHHRVGKDSIQMQSVDYDSSNRMFKTSAGPKVKKKFTKNGKEESKVQENNPELTEKPVKDTPISKKCCLTGGMCPQERKVKPVVCGNSGIISIGNLPGKSKPVKIVSLNLVLKLAKRCNLSDNEKEPRQASDLQTENAGCFSPIEVTQEPFVAKRVRDSGGGNSMYNLNAQVKPRCKETRKRRLSELTENSKDTKDALCLRTFGESQCSKLMQAGCHSKNSPRTGASDDLFGSKLRHEKSKMKPLSKYSQKPNSRSGKSPQGSQDFAAELCHTSARKLSSTQRKCQQSLLDSDAFCCVCGSSNKDDVNHLLECNNCLIRVHQACYGVSKVPKGHWCCRPCRVSSKNIACVLCGYEGGAMTRAVRSRNIVKSLLKAWKEGPTCLSMKSSPSLADGVKAFNPSSEICTGTGFEEL